MISLLFYSVCVKPVLQKINIQNMGHKNIQMIKYWPVYQYSKQSELCAYTPLFCVCGNLFLIHLIGLKYVGGLDLCILNT